MRSTTCILVNLDCNKNAIEQNIFDSFIIPCMEKVPYYLESLLNWSSLIEENIFKDWKIQTILIKNY